ncbi:type IV secretion system protein [Alcaligenes sp. CHO6]|uniref:type IV secretion system protein n=1 Tax=Alcaligenes sp. CHO6 TaxID=3123298 RepID=UPI003014B555
MKSISALAAGLCLAFSLVSPSYSAGGIPTLDVNSIPQLNALLDQLETARAQLQQAQAQVQALTHSSGFGYVLENADVRRMMRDSLPSDASALLNRLDGQNSTLSSSISAIAEDVNAPVNFQQDSKALRERSVRIAATKKAMSEQAYNAMTKRLETIDGLQAQINQTTNPKEIAELQARIAIEQANIQADQTRIQLAEQQFAAESALLEERGNVVYGGWFGGRNRQATP